MTVILVVHILVSLVLVGVVLLQRSEGGALGVGGGGGGGGLMSGRGTAGALVRTTIVFGAIFFITSLVLTTMSSREASDGRTAIERQLEQESGGAGTDSLDVLNDTDTPLLGDRPGANDDSDTLKNVPESSSQGSVVEDPLAADIEPESGSQQEPVEDPQ